MLMVLYGPTVPALVGKNHFIFVLTTQVLESVVKNCGQTVHDEVASKQTMEELKELLKVPLSIMGWFPLHLH